jgi:chromosome segregation ATPase/pimeloyl-ACP methyl ester carboxylesterase
LQSSSDIAGIISRFGNAVTSLETQKNQLKPSTNGYSTKINIMDDFVAKFNTARNQLNTLKTYAISYESLMVSGITPGEVNEINSILAAAQGVYGQLASSYDLLMDKIVNQRTKWENRDYANSINVGDHIAPYIKDPSYDNRGGREILLIYKVNAELSRDKLTEVRTNITDLRDKAWTPYVNLISTLYAQITTLENNRNVKDSEYQNKITSKYGDIAQKDSAIISKQGEINTVNSSISTIIGQINPNKQKLLELLKENTTLVKEWKALLRNESHYFLDNAELLIYQDLYSDWEKLANNVTAPFLNKLQLINSNYLGDIQAPIEEYQEDLENGIVWAKNRRETIESIGNNSKVVFDQLLQEFRATPSQNSNLPLEKFADNLQKIQERRDNLLTSYDDLTRQITQVKSWLTEAKATPANSIDSSRLQRYIQQLEFTQKRLSLVPNAIAEIDPIKENFTEELNQLKSLWGQINSDFSGLVNEGKNKVNLDNQLQSKKSSRITLEGDLAKLEEEKTNLVSKASYLQGQLNTTSSKIVTLSNQLNSANSALSNINSSVNYWQGEVNRIRTADGGFFKWDSQQNLVTRDERIANYRTYVTNLLKFSNDLTAQKSLITQYEREIYNSSFYQTDLASQLQSTNYRIAELTNTLIPNKNGEISSNTSQINSLGTDITKSTQALLNLSNVFFQKLATLKGEFNDIDVSLTSQASLGESLLSLGLLVTEQDINFFTEIIEPAVGKFYGEINGGNTLLNSLNPSLDSLRNTVNSTNINDAPKLVQEFIKNFQQLLTNQKSELGTYINKQYPEVITDFDKAHKEAQKEVEEIQFDYRLRSLIQQENLAEVIETIQSRINIAQKAYLVTGNGQISRSNVIGLKIVIHDEVIEDIEKQKTILNEVDQANKYIDGNLTKLAESSQELFKAFEFKLPKTLGNYLRASGDLDAKIDIQTVLDQRLGAINDSVNSVKNAIASFKQKISSQNSLNDKIAGISKELTFSDQALAFVQIQELLEKDNLSVDNLTKGIAQLTSFIQNLINTASLDSVNVQSLNNAKQSIQQLTALSTELSNFENENSELEAQLIEISEKEVALLDAAILYKARSNEEAKISQKEGIEVQKNVTIKDLIVSGEINTKNLENRYFLSPQAGTWQEIQDFAKSVRGNLVTINGLKEQQFLKRIFGLNANGTANSQANYWIGYSDKDKEGKWQWVDGQVDDFENWSDRTNGNGKDYAFMNQFGLWKVANNQEKFQGIIELDFNATTVERLQIEKQLQQADANLKTSFENNQNYQSIVSAIASVETSFTKALNIAGISQLTTAELLTEIRQNYRESQQTLNELESDINWRQASANAHFKTAEFYQSVAAEYLQKHNDLKQKFANQLGVVIPNEEIWTEPRETSITGLFGKKSVSVEITHINTYWLYYEKFTELSKAARQQALERLGQPSTNSTSTAVASDLLSQRNQASTINQLWGQANQQADVLEGLLKELQSSIDRINIANKQTPEYQQAVNQFELLLPTLDTQLTNAQVKTENAYNSVKQQWDTFKNSVVDLQQVYDKVIPLKAEYRGQNLAILSDIDTSREWVTLKYQSLEVELESVSVVRNQLNDFLRAGNNSSINSITQNLLKDALNYLKYNESILQDRLEALNEHREALDAQEKFLLQELELIDAYFDNGGKEFTLLNQQLDRAKTTLRDLQSFAEDALDSSTVLTQNLNQFSVYLNSLNDEHLKAVQDSHETLQDLIANFNDRKDSFEEAKKSLDEINGKSPEIIKLLEKMVANGEVRATQLLETAKLRGLAVAADIYFQDFSDLMTDTGNFWSGGIATEADRKLANYFRKTLMENRALKRESEANADYAGTVIKHAEGQKTLIESEIQEAQIEYNNLLATIGNLEQASDVQRQTLYELQARKETLEALQDPTRIIINNLIQVQTLNADLARLEQQYAESFSKEINESLREQLSLDALAKSYQKQQLLTKIEVYQKQDAYSALQDSLIEIGRELGLEINPIIESTDHKADIIDLQEQLNNLQINPEIPQELRTLLEEVTGNIESALQGEEATQIEEQLSVVTNKLVEQNKTYQQELDRILEEAQDDQDLLDTAQTDLKTAVDQLLTAIETRNDFLEDKSVINNELLRIFAEVRLAQNANSISTETAKKARTMLNDVLEQRQVEREARQKTFIDFLLESQGTLLAIASVVVTAGSSAGLIALTGAALKSIKIGLAVAKAVNNAVTAAYNGDWSGALYNAINAVTMYVGDMNISDALKDNISQFQSIVDSSYKALKSAQSGDALGAFIDGIGGLTSMAIEGFDLAGKAGLSDDFIKEFKKIPGLVENSIQAIQEGDWLTASSNIFNTVIAISSMRSISDVESGKFAKKVNIIDAVGDVGFSIANAIKESDFTTWVTTVNDVLQRHQFFKTSQKAINKKVLETLAFETVETAKLKTNNGEQDVDFIALNGQVNPNKPTYVIVGGYLTDSGSEWLTDTSFLLQKNVGDANFIIVDWSELTGSFLAPFDDGIYRGAAENTKLVGEALGNYLLNQGIDPKNIHLVGHSLGAHVIGVAGRTIAESSGQKIKEIIALDPAGPSFDQKFRGLQITDLRDKLDISDADSVTVVRSNFTNDSVLQKATSSLINLGHYGTSKNDLGHIDVEFTSEMNKFYLKDSHGDAIQFFQHFLTRSNEYGGNIKLFGDDLEAGTITETFTQFQDKIDILREQKIAEAKDKGINVGERIESYSENFALNIQYQANNFTYQNTSQSFNFTVQPKQKSFEVIPQGIKRDQFLGIVDFDTAAFKLETSFDAGKTWEVVNPYDINSKLQFLSDDRRYLITPQTETGVASLKFNGLAIGSVPPTLAITPTNATQTEGNSGNKAFNFTVTRSSSITGINAVNWAVTGTAIDAADFGGTLPSGIVTFAANETSKVITINVSGDTTVEPDENFIVTLSNPTNGATLTTATATGIIQNDDIPNIDLNPPQLTYFDVISDQVDISNQSQSIQIKLGLSDDFSGVKSAGIVFVSPSGKQSISNTIQPNYDRVSGDALNGVYQKILTLPRFAEIGTWRVREISLYDNDDKNQYLTFADLTNPNFDLDFKVTGIGDTVPPELVSIIVSPEQLNTSNNSANIEVNIQITDNLSGLQYLGIVFVSPSGEQTISSTIWADYDRVSGDSLNGVYRKQLSLPQNSENGNWQVRDISLYDNVGNGKYFTRSELTNPNFDLNFVVGITQSSPLIAIAPTNVTQTEGNSGSKAFTFTVTRSGSTTGTNAVNWTVTGTGTNPANATDFGGTLPSGIVTFAANETSKVITVNVSGDTTVEPDENFIITLSNPTNNATLTTTTSVTGTITNDDVFTAIESADNTKLVKDSTNKYFTQIGTNTPTAIKDGGQQIYQDIYGSGWQTIAAETVNGVNQVLWKNITGNYLHIWHLDSNWNWVSSEGNWGLNSADAFTQETNFGIDTNGDDIIGNPYILIEAAGNTKLVKDSTNKYFTQIGINTPTAIKNGGQQIYQDIYGSGWQTIAAETVNGVNQVLWKNIPGNYLHIWHLDNNWNWVSSEGNWGLNSADAFTQETNFGIDANGDGAIGNPVGNPYILIEAAGNTKLVKDSTNKYFSQVGTNTPTTIKNGGQQIFQNVYAGWQTLAAETVNGDNQVLWKNIAGNYLHIWHLDSNWNWVSSEGNWGLNSADAFTQETNFGIDANADGIIGNPYTSIESTGNTKLVKDTANKYFAQVGTATPIAIQNSGVQIFPDIYPGWQTLAVETVNGDNQVLWKNTAGNYLHIWHLDNSWNRVSSEGQFALNSADAFTQETNFGIDGNGDGIIGNPYIAIV